MEVSSAVRGGVKMSAADRQVEEEYLRQLGTLRLNSKPVINSLTMMAEDFITSAHVVVATIEGHLERVRPEGKLPILYLIDSIVKNIKKDYIPLFTKNIVSTFTSVFGKVDDRTRTQMFKLRQTWNDIFPFRELQAIDVKIHKEMDPGWPLPANPNTIHLNPIFLSRQTPLSLPRAPLLATTASPIYESSSGSPISLTEPLGDESDQMREQLLIKKKQLIELQQQKVQLELLQLENAQKKKMQEENYKKQQLLKLAELAPQQTMAATSIIASLSTPTPSASVAPASQGNNSKTPPVPAPKSSSVNNVGFSNDPRLNRNRTKPIPTPPPPPNISSLIQPVASARSSPAPQQKPKTPPPPVIQPPAPTQIKVEKSMSPRKSETSGKSKSTDRSSPVVQKQGEPPKRIDSPTAVSVKKEKHVDSSPEKSKHKSSSSSRHSKDKESSSRSSSGKGSSSRESSSSSKSPCKSDKSSRKSSRDSNGKPKPESKEIADPVNYEDEELGYSGITIKPTPPRRDQPEVAKASSSSSQSKSSQQSSARSGSKDKEPRDQVKSEPSSTSRSSAKLDRVNSNTRRNQSKSTKESPSRRRQDSPRASSSNRSKDNVSHQRTDENVRDSYTKRKTMVLSRNYRKRGALQDDEKETSTDVDLRYEGLRDVDLRASPPKKSKSSASTSAFIDNLFGREDVDLRQSQQSTSWSQVKKPKGAGRIENMDEQPTRPSSAISPASSVGSTCDPLGRPLIYTRLPDDPDQRRRSLGSRSSSVDPLEAFRFRYIEKPSRDSGGNLSGADLKLAFIRVKEELESGKLNDNQYNLIIKQLIQINETSKIREVQQMDMTDMKPGVGVMQSMNTNNLPNPWTAAGNPFNPQPSAPVIMPNIVNPMFRPRGPSGEFLQVGAGMQGVWRPGGPQQQQPFGLHVQQPRGPNPFIEASVGVLQQQTQPLPPNLIPIPNPRELAQLEMEYESTIPLDKVTRVVRFYGRTAVVMVGEMGDEPRQISFQIEAAPRTVLINREPISIRIGRSTTFYLGRTKHTIEIGVPTKELYIDGIGYEVCFGGGPTQIQHNGEWISLLLQGPPPRVEIGTVKRYDLVAGRTTVIIDGNPKPLFLDERPQLVDFSGFSVILRFCDEFHGVLLNGRPFPTNFGGPPRPMILAGSGRVVNIRFIAISRSTELNMIQHIRLRGLSTLPPDEVLLGDGPAPRGHPLRGGRGEINVPDPAPIRDANREVDLFDVLANSLQPVSSNDKSYETDTDVSKPKVPQEQPQQPLNVQDLVSKLLMAGLLPAASVKPDSPPPPTTTASTLAVVTDPVAAEPAPEVEAPAPVPPKPETPQKEIPKVTFDDNLKIRRQFLVDSLYEGVQCGSCGLRFGQDQTFRYTQHLDWHFRQNRREKTYNRKALSRKWYYDLSDWIQFEEIEDLEGRGVANFESTTDGNEIPDDFVEDSKRVLNPDSYTVLAAGYEGATCPQCGEEFETFYDEDKEEWRLRDALLPEDQEDSNPEEKNKLFHPICHQDYQAALLASANDSTKMEEDLAEDDEVMILKEGKKEVVLMEIDVEDDAAVDETDSGASPFVEVVDSPLIADDSNSRDLSVGSPAVRSATPVIESDSLDQPRGPSYTILPAASEPMHVDECIDLTLPGIASAGTGLENSTNSNSIFSIVLDESNPGRPSTPDKLIVYENMKFDFPKIKVEPVEWDDIEEDAMVKIVGAEADASASPLNITLDDDDEEEAKVTATTHETEPKAADPIQHTQIDLTAEDDPVEEDNSVTTHIDGNLVFKGLSGHGTVAPPLAGKIRINITGLDIPSSTAGSSPSRKSPARKSPDAIMSPGPETGDKRESAPPDLDKLFNSAEMKAIKPRLAGKKFTNCPVKKDKKAEESGLCSIC